MGQADVADVLCLLDGGQLCEDFLTIDAVATEGVDGQVADAKGGEVLEEVGALAWVNLKAVESCLHDDLRGTDLRPLDGNAQPGVAAAPSPGADEQIRRPTPALP